MSTRSGKRIHKSILENVETFSETQIERKTRNKRVKDTSDEVATAKKKKNFVRCPSDDEVESSNDKTENTTKSVRKSRRHTLKELNIPAADYEALKSRKSMRQSRRTRKEDTVEPSNVPIQETNEIGKLKKKSKKKKAVIENLENEAVESVIITEKKTSKKKRKSNSFIVEELVMGQHNKSFNKSNVSIDSFHSATGSPAKHNFKYEAKNDDKSGKYRVKKEKSSFTPNDYVENVNDTKKNIKKPEKDNYFVTIDESVKLCVSNETFKSNENKINEDKDENEFEYEISGTSTSKTKSKKKRSKESVFLSNMENTHTKAKFINGTELTNSIEANIHSTDLKRNSIEKINKMDTSTFDLTNIPHVNGTGNDLETVSPLNNSSKKRRKSTSKNSISDKIDTSITLLTGSTKKKSDNLMIETKNQSDVISINQTTSSQKPRKKSKSKDASYEKINLSESNLDQTFDKTNNSFNKNSSLNEELSLNNGRNSRRESCIKNTTYDKIEENIVDMDTTFNKEPAYLSNAEQSSTTKKSSRPSRNSLPPGEVSTVFNGTYDKISKNDSTSFCNNTYDKTKLDTTFERTKDIIDEDNTINLNPKSSIISSDNTENMTSDMSEDCSRISVTSDDSTTENIVNTTPLLIESSMDESLLNSASILRNKTATPQKDEVVTKIITPDKQGSLSDNNKTPPKREEPFTETNVTPLKRDGSYTVLRKTPLKRRATLSEEPKPQVSENPMTPLKREGTFTKESPDVMSPKSISVDKTPTRRKSMPSPGRTPFSLNRSVARDKVALNVTHSIEKPQRRSSVAAVPPRLTKVMFCSPVDNPVAVTQMKGKVIKSNLKGSNKSFMFDDSVSEQGVGSRKRSRTHGCADGGAKRVRRADTTATRPRTASAAARLQAPVGTDATPPVAKSDAKTRTKLPDFAALHQKQFSKMESLDECQRRRARRAQALLTPTALRPSSALRALTAPQASISPVTTTATGALTGNIDETSDTAQSQPAKRPETPKCKEIDKKNQSYTRFGFKLNLDVNPFSVPAKTADINPKYIIKPKVSKRQPTLPSLAGTTLRKEAAKQTVMREKSFTEKRDNNRNQNRTVIKGVRTNRRFELQMKMRNID